VGRAHAGFLKYIKKGDVTMGAWDCDPFSNDTAGDWSDSLEKCKDLSLIEATIKKINDCGTEYLDAPQAEEAIVAADTLARLKGSFYEKNAYTQTVDDWVKSHKITPPSQLLNAAMKAMDRILTSPSELLESWQDTEDYEKWKTHLAELKTRLQ
jgi:hypothetical protein